MRSLRRLASIAEIIASIAVVVSVLFIIFELRSNTNAIQAQTYQYLTSDLNDWRELAFESPWLRTGYPQNWQEITLE